MTSDESTNDAMHASMPSAKKRSKKADHSEGERPRLSEAERSRQRREEKLRPRIDQLASAPPAQFGTVLEGLIKELKRERARQDELHFLLRAALLQIPPGHSGAMVVKHFKYGSEWSNAELSAALLGVKDAITARKADVSKLGPMLHGTLIALVGAAQSLATPAGTGAEQDDVLAALVALHAAVWDSERAPLTGLSEPHPHRVLDIANSLFERFKDRIDVQAVVGQGLFGFDRVLTIDPASQAGLVSKPVAAAQEVGEASSQQPANHSAQQLSAKETKKEERIAGITAAKPVGREAALQRELESAERLLEASDRACETLRRDRESDRQALAALRRELGLSIESRESLTQQVTELQSALEQAGKVAVHLQDEQARNHEANLTIQRLLRTVQDAEGQIQLAKESEFDRGRRAMRAAVAAHCVESLSHIAELAAPLEGDAGQFIPAAARALVRYLTEGKD